MPKFRSHAFQERAYRAAIVIAGLMLVAELFSLPLLVTFDGYWYARLAEVLGTTRFQTEWDFLRTPVFPALLKLFFWLFGRGPLAVIALQSILAFSGIWLLAATLRRFDRGLEAAILFPFLACFPTLVTYEHALLTEAGTFFFLALLIYVIAAPISSPERNACILAGVSALGYYHRATLLYISPAVAIVFAVRLWREWGIEAGAARRVQLRRVAATVVVVFGPFLLAYPWSRDSRVAVRTGQSVLLYGLAKQAVAPPADPIWSKAQTSYAQAIDRSTRAGRLSLSGVRDELVYAPLDTLRDYAPDAQSVFVGTVVRYPSRYIAGCVRTALLFTELYPSESDNASFRSSVLFDNGAIAPHPVGFPPLDVEMLLQPKRSAAARILAAIAPVYDHLVCLGLFATLALLVAGIWRKDPAMLAFGIVPVAFLLLNIAVLSSQDRMATPAYPVVLTNLVLLPGVVGRTRAWGRLRCRVSPRAASASANSMRKDLRAHPDVAEPVRTDAEGSSHSPFTG